MDDIARIRGELRCLVRELGLLDRNCWGSGLSLMQAHVLTCLRRDGDMPVAGLRAQLNVEKASLSRSLAALEARGLLARRVDGADRRRKLVALLPAGEAALARADRSADAEVSGILDGLGADEVDAIWRGLRLLRIRTFRRNLDRSGARIRMERLAPAYLGEARALMDAAFAGEQGIPAGLVPLPEGLPAHWWCARIGEYVVGAAACWFEGGRWHWGRFVVDPNFRGLGIGGRLARFSLGDFFENVADAIVSDARDITVAILKACGARVTGPAQDFYGMPVTPMALDKADFRQRPDAD